MAIGPRQVLATARGDIGTHERPGNRTNFGRRYGLDGVPWCGIWVWSVFVRCGIDLREHGVTDPHSTNLLDEQAAAAGWGRVRPADAAAGDLVLFGFGDLDGPGPDSADDNDHVGIVEQAAARGYLVSIEGNTSSGERGSQANGDGVYRRRRHLDLVRRVYRPPYAAWSQQQSASADQEDPDMDLTSTVKLTEADANALGDDYRAGQEVSVAWLLRQAATAYARLAKRLDRIEQRLDTHR